MSVDALEAVRSLTLAPEKGVGFHVTAFQPKGKEHERKEVSVNSLFNVNA